MSESKQIVVASYAEDLGWLDQLPEDWSAVIYNAHPDCVIKSKWPVHKVKNTGGEASQWLTHLAAQWDNLADVTVFLQGNPFDHVPNLWEVLQRPFPFEFKYLEPVKPFWRSPKDMPMEGQFFKNLWGDKPWPKQTAFRKGAQFHVRKSLVQQMPTEHYQRALDIMPGFRLSLILQPFWRLMFAP